jgi:hypothetical protein
MTKNVGTVDRLLRIAVAIVIFAMIAMGTLSGTWAIILGILAAVFVGTSLIGTCPLYMPFGVSTMGPRPDKD